MDIVSKYFHKALNNEAGNEIHNIPPMETKIDNEVHKAIKKQYFLDSVCKTRQLENDPTEFSRGIREIKSKILTPFKIIDKGYVEIFVA